MARITDHPDMTSPIYRGHKALNEKKTSIDEEKRESSAVDIVCNSFFFDIGVYRAFEFPSRKQVRVTNTPLHPTFI